MTALIWTQVFDAMPSSRTPCSIGFPSKSFKFFNFFLLTFPQTLMLVTFLLLQVCLVAGEDTVLICQSNRTEQGDTKVYFATWAERTWLVVKYLKYLDPGCTDDCSTATHECEPVCWVKCSSSPEKVCHCFIFLSRETDQLTTKVKINCLGEMFRIRRKRPIRSLFFVGI